MIGLRSFRRLFAVGHAKPGEPVKVTEIVTCSLCGKRSALLSVRAWPGEDIRTGETECCHNTQSPMDFDDHKEGA